MFIIPIRNFLGGKMGLVQLGDFASVVESHFGEPDDKGGTSRKYRWPCIWKYGDYEFHFNHFDRRLWLIHAEFNRNVCLSSQNIFQINPPIISAGLLKSALLDILRRESIHFVEQKVDELEITQIKTLNATIAFTNDPNDESLESISINLCI